jgi:hypothetical protein
MKKNILILFSLLSQIALSQSIVKSSIDNGGATVNTPGIKMVYTIGEVNVQEVTVGNIGVSEGFVGPNLFSSGIYIPDANFEQALIDQEIDTDPTPNKMISREDAEAITKLDIVSKEISDLTGIDFKHGLKHYQQTEHFDTTLLCC